MAHALPSYALPRKAAGRSSALSLVDASFQQFAAVVLWRAWACGEVAMSNASTQIPQAAIEAVKEVIESRLPVFIPAPLVEAALTAAIPHLQGCAKLSIQQRETPEENYKVDGNQLC